MKHFLAWNIPIFYPMNISLQPKFLFSEILHHLKRMVFFPNKIIWDVYHLSTGDSDFTTIHSVGTDYRRLSRLKDEDITHLEPPWETARGPVSRGEGHGLGNGLGNLGDHSPRSTMSTDWWFGCHGFYFPRNIGNNHPNWLSYFSEGFKPPTSQPINQYHSGLPSLEACHGLPCYADERTWIVSIKLLLWG